MKEQLEKARERGFQSTYTERAQRRMRMLRSKILQIRAKNQKIECLVGRYPNKGEISKNGEFTTKIYPYRANIPNIGCLIRKYSIQNKNLKSGAFRSKISDLSTQIQNRDV